MFDDFPEDLSLQDTDPWVETYYFEDRNDSATLNTLSPEQIQAIAQTFAVIDTIVMPHIKDPTQFTDVFNAMHDAAARVIDGTTTLSKLLGSARRVAPGTFEHYKARLCIKAARLALALLDDDHLIARNEE